MFPCQVFLGYNFYIMLKGLAIFVLLAAGTIDNSGQENQRSNLTDPNSRQHTAPPVVLKCECSAQPNQQSANPKPPHWYTSPEWWLCILGVPTLFYIGKQARASKEAATAALKQANHIVNSERAWVLILREKTQNPYLVPIEKPLAGGPRMSHCIVWIKNYGNSPARIAKFKFELQIGERRTAPPRTEVFEPKSLEFDKNPLAMPQQDEWPMEAKLTPEGIIRDEQRKEILENKRRFLWLCGAVHYRDVFDGATLHTSKICLLYETLTDAKEPFWVYGPPEYNTTTEQQCPKQIRTLPSLRSG
jgi:hypothetical protein